MSKFQGGPLDVADRIVGYLNEMRPRETDDLPGAGDTDSAVNRLCEWREDVFLVLPEDDRYWRQLSDLLRELHRAYPDLQAWHKIESFWLAEVCVR